MWDLCITGGSGLGERFSQMYDSKNEADVFRWELGAKLTRPCFQLIRLTEMRNWGNKYPICILITRLRMSRCSAIIATSYSPDGVSQ